MLISGDDSMRVVVFFCVEPSLDGEQNLTKESGDYCKQGLILCLPSHSGGLT